MAKASGSISSVMSLRGRMFYWIPTIDPLEFRSDHLGSRRRVPRNSMVSVITIAGEDEGCCTVRPFLGSESDSQVTKKVGFGLVFCERAGDENRTRVLSLGS